MELSEMRVSVNPQQIHYATASFKQLVIREVYDGEYPNGEYHIKPIQKINQQFLVNFLKKAISGVEIGVADPDETLNLEYPVYLKSDTSRHDIIINLEKADKDLDNFIKNRKKSQKGG